MRLRGIGSQQDCVRTRQICRDGFDFLLAVRKRNQLASLWAGDRPQNRIVSLPSESMRPLRHTA